MINKILILGGGTSGWLTAAYLVKNLLKPTQIILIEDTKLGPIGVGEGTQPATARFLYECGLEPKDWMKASNASFKFGVELVNWTDEPYFVDNDTNLNHYIAEGLFSSHYFANKSKKEFNEWHPAYRLAKANKSPKFSENRDFNNTLPEGSYGAVHFSALDIVKVIKSKIIDKIIYIDTDITSVYNDSNGITYLEDNNKVQYSADLYIDCTGFKSLLLGKALEVPFESYEDILPCDRAVAIQTQYKDPEIECFPYTRSTAMDAGWRWTIPIYNRIGNGYVYSSKFLSDDEAEQELRKSIRDFKSPANRLKMKCGRYKDIFVKNVCAIGLSAGFVEPLEATGITFTTAVVKSLTKLLNIQVPNIKLELNNWFKDMVEEIVAFVWSHYYFSTKNDTNFWKYIRTLEYNNKFIPFIDDSVYSNKMFRAGSSMFNNVQWFQVYHTFINNKELSIEDSEYAKYILDSISARVDLALNTLPNQYSYLSNWYNKE